MATLLLKNDVILFCFFIAMGKGKQLWQKDSMQLAVVYEIMYLHADAGTWPVKTCMATW